MAELLKSVWNIDILICPECGCGRMRCIGRTYAALLTFHSGRVIKYSFQLRIFWKDSAAEVSAQSAVRIANTKHWTVTV
ncbi:MAG: hypothetical protein MSH59_14870, partial [[Clostridium] innocuum]|nr:hypothetical protein [[Clostridium] innocuum]